MPIKVELLPHDPRWQDVAAVESERLRTALGDILVTVHHIGSTAVPGIRAKPVIDLIPVVDSLERLDALQGAVEGLGLPLARRTGAGGAALLRQGRPRDRTPPGSAALL